MCIIVFKDKGVSVPSTDILTTCWENNPDGAGICLIRANDPSTTFVSKGYMKLNEFLQNIKLMNIQKEDIVFYHFRIATSGGVNPEKTHPFPITDDVTALNATGHFYATQVFIHNGILGAGQVDLSDTQLYIKNELVHYMKIEDEYTKKLVLDKTTDRCRTVTIDTDKSFLHLTGNWVTDKGLKFSNSTYNKKTVYIYGGQQNYGLPDYLTRPNSYYKPKFKSNVSYHHNTFKAIKEKNLT